VKVRKIFNQHGAELMQNFKTELSDVRQVVAQLRKLDKDCYLSPKAYDDDQLLLDMVLPQSEVNDVAIDKAKIQI